MIIRYIGKIWDGRQKVKSPIVWDFPDIWKRGLSCTHKHRVSGIIRYIGKIWDGRQKLKSAITWIFATYENQALWLWATCTLPFILDCRLVGRSSFKDSVTVGKDGGPVESTSWEKKSLTRKSLGLDSDADPQAFAGEDCVTSQKNVCVGGHTRN